MSKPVFANNPRVSTLGGSIARIMDPMSRFGPRIALAPHADGSAAAGDRDTIMVSTTMHVDCQVRLDQFNETERTVEIIWAAGAAVKRYSWDEGYYIEELSMDPKHIRMDRFVNGMSFLDVHDAYSGMDARLGTVLPKSVRIENGKGYATIKLSRNARGEALFQDLRDGHGFPVSVGYKTHAYEKREGSESALPTLRAIDWEPMELSAVPVPADAGAHSRGEKPVDGETSIVAIRRDAPTNAASAAPKKELPMDKRAAAKSFTGEKLDALAIGFGITRADGETDEALRARLVAHFDTQDATETARNEQDRVRREADETTRRAADAAALAAANQGNLTATQVADMQRAAANAERQRIADIRAYGTRLRISDEAIQTAVNDGRSMDAFRMFAIEEAAVRHENNSDGNRSGGHADFRGGQDERTLFRTAATNALLHRLGLIKPTELTEQGRELRGMALMDLAREEMRLRNVSTRGSVNEIASRAFHTTSDFPLIMGDITRRTVLAGYQGYPNTFQLFANRNVVPDFREVKTLELGAAPDLEKVNEAGEFKSGTMTMSEEGYMIQTYGKIIGFTRQLLINDQLNAFANAIRQWGGKAAKLEGDVVWKAIIDNVKLKDGNGIFHASHLNLGTAAALSQASLDTARTAMRKQKDLDGSLMPVVPRFLYVGSALEPIATRIVSAAYAPNTLANVTPEWIKALQVVYEPRLDAISDTVWFLFSDAQSVNGRGMQYAYLQGQEEPFTDEEVGFNVDGVKYKIRHDFGAGPTDYRFGYKNAGAAQP